MSAALTTPFLAAAALDAAFAAYTAAQSRIARLSLAQVAASVVAAAPNAAAFVLSRDYDNETLILTGVLDAAGEDALAADIDVVDLDEDRHATNLDDANQFAWGPLAEDGDADDDFVFTVAAATAVLALDAVARRVVAAAPEATKVVLVPTADRGVRFAFATDDDDAAVALAADIALAADFTLAGVPEAAVAALRGVYAQGRRIVRVEDLLAA